ncbi:MAG: hypothetical protein RLZZ528_834 [Pseudomonadota bacterium]
MLIKTILLFLVVMAVLGVFGRIRFGGPPRGPGTCKSCGRPLIGKGPCGCGGQA